MFELDRVGGLGYVGLRAWFRCLLLVRFVDSSLGFGFGVWGLGCWLVVCLSCVLVCLTFAVVDMAVYVCVAC